MNVNYLIPFVEAAYEVLKADTGYDMKRGELQLDKNAYVTNEITVLISLVGDIEGNVIFGMSEATAVSFASAILGEKLLAFDGLAQSGVAELGNVITGRASVKLSQAGYESTISPPTMLLGKGARLSTLDIARLVVPLEGTPGIITIQLALRESPTRGISSAKLKIPSAPNL